MNHEELMKSVERKLSQKRYNHTMGVYKAAKNLANVYGVDWEKAGLAALLHDYAKNDPKEIQKHAIIHSDYPNEIINMNPQIWHAFAGAYLAKVEFEIHDFEILNAIAYHTTGHRSMSKLDMIIYLADLIEEGRQYPGVNELREIALIDLNEAMLYAVKNTLQFLIRHNESIAPYTLDLYHDLIIHSKGRE